MSNEIEDMKLARDLVVAMDEIHCATETPYSARFDREPALRDDLARAIGRMRDDGIAFTEEAVWHLAGGCDNDFAELTYYADGYDDLVEIVESIFEDTGV